MKSFKFPLESLRVLRQQKERAAQQRYAQALATSDLAAAKLQGIVNELANVYQSIVNSMATGLPGSQIMERRAWCSVLEVRRNEARAALEETRRAAEKAFKDMVLAVRDREAMDRFYEKSRAAHEREAAADEQKNLDEIAIQMSNANPLFQFAGNEHLN
jgi:flagellar export protein FliJ